MELVLFGLLVTFALLVPWLGKDSREPGDWHVPFESRRSPRTYTEPDRAEPAPQKAAPCPGVVGQPRHGL